MEDDNTQAYEEAEQSFPGEPEKHHFLRTHRRKLLILLGTLILFCLVLVALVSVVVPISVIFSGSGSEDTENGTQDGTNSSATPVPSPYVPEYIQQPIPTNEEPNTYVIPATPNITTEIIYHSSEYQITLDDLSHWKNREAELAKWIENINADISYLNVERKDVNCSARYQYKIDASGSNRCSNSKEFRVRDYISDYWAGNTMIDIKGNEGDESVAYNLPFWPAEQYNSLENSHQKCEKDVHSCNDKYARETRIYFEYHPLFSTCFDLLQLYPWAFSGMSVSARSHQVAVTETGYWWVGSYFGIMDGDTKYEITWTLEYHNKDDAIYGTAAPYYGEWSIRIYTVSDGLSENYNPDVQQATFNLWTSLQSTFGNRDSFDC